MMERLIYPLFGMFPWRCSRCRTRVLLQDRGDRRLYVSMTDGTGTRRRRSSDQIRARHGDEDAA